MRFPLVVKTNMSQICDHNLGSGGWLAWANDTTTHYAAIHCLCQRTIGPAVQHADMPLPLWTTVMVFLSRLLVLRFTHWVCSSTWSLYLSPRVGPAGVE